MNLKKRLSEQLLLDGRIKEFYGKYFSGSGNDKWTVKCPFHEDKNPSLSINLREGWFNCFSCKAKGDIYEFRMRKENLSFPDCLARFAEEVGISGKSQSEEGRFGHIYVKSCADMLFQVEGNQTRGFLVNTRGLTEETLRAFHIGYDPKTKEIVVPVFDGSGEGLSQLRFFKYDVSTGEKKVRSPRGSRTSLFGLQHLPRAPFDEAIVVAEGEIDTMILNQNGFTAVTGTGGAKTWKQDWSKHFKDRDVIICYDSDSAGRSGAVKVAEALLGTASTVRVVDLFGDEATKETKDLSDYFVRCGHTQDDFRMLIESAEPFKIEKSAQAGFFEDLEKARKEVTIHPAQDYFNGTFCYAVRAGANWYLITSEIETIAFKDCKERGIILATSDLDTPRFSVDGIRRYMRSTRDVNPQELFERITEYLTRFVILKDSHAFIFLALWIMGTYVFRIFRYYPYVHLSGEKATGKTFLMDIMKYVCFNGEISVNSTEAVLFRDIQNNLPTLFLDEIEQLRRQDKDRHGAIMGVLKAGFNREGKVKRCGGKNMDRVQSFSAFSPKMLAGINDIDDVLRDRTVRIKMVRRLDSEKIEHYRQNRELEVVQSDLRDQLYILGLTYGPQMASIYLESPDSITTGIDLANREYDIWIPMFLLANVVDAARGDQKGVVTERLATFARRLIADKQQDDAEENETGRLLTVMNHAVQELTPVRERGMVHLFDTTEIFDFVQSQDEFAWLESKSKAWLTRRLKRLDFQVEPYRGIGKTRKAYVIDLTGLKELTQRFLSKNVTVTENVTDDIGQ